MSDTREAILARLLVLAGTVTGVASAARNRLDVSKLQRPAVVILDGAEQLSSAPNSGRGETRSEVQLMELSPLISCYVRSSDSVDAGSLCSLYRCRLLTAILNDATLIGLVGKNGRISYEGATVAPPAAEGAEYRVDLIVAFTYLFTLADIAA
jgi:hypothetical protein